METTFSPDEIDILKLKIEPYSWKTSIAVGGYTEPHSSINPYPEGHFIGVSDEKITIDNLQLLYDNAILETKGVILPQRRENIRQLLIDQLEHLADFFQDQKNVDRFKERGVSHEFTHYIQEVRYKVFSLLRKYSSLRQEDGRPLVDRSLPLMIRSLIEAQAYILMFKKLDRDKASSMTTFGLMRILLPLLEEPPEKGGLGELHNLYQNKFSDISYELEPYYGAMLILITGSVGIVDHLRHPECDLGAFQDWLAEAWQEILEDPGILWDRIHDQHFLLELDGKLRDKVVGLKQAIAQ